MFDAIGGVEGCRKLAQTFYSLVDQDPILRPLFPGKSLRCATEEFTAFLVQFLGGPSEHTQFRWWLSLRESHARFKLGAKERAAWLKNMRAALDTVELDESVRQQLREFFSQASSYLTNGVSPQFNGNLAQRWSAQLALDETTAAIRKNDAQSAIALIEQSAWHPSALNGVFALILKTGNSELIEYLTRRLNHDPSLAQQRFNGRTLLHAAAIAGNAEVAELLMKLGIDANIKDAGRHTPLYYASTADVVRVLLKAGASVDACDGVKSCTPLHMAARWGNVAVAEALLDAGANINARDTQGVTPYRRALNCRKKGVADLLKARGAR